MLLLEYYEEVALPTLALAQVDVTRGVLDDGQKIAYEIVADKRTGRSSADNLKSV
jgi:hypothetical protein